MYMKEHCTHRSWSHRSRSSRIFPRIVTVSSASTSKILSLFNILKINGNIHFVLAAWLPHPSNWYRISYNWKSFCLSPTLLPHVVAPKLAICKFCRSLNNQFYTIVQIWKAWLQRCREEFVSPFYLTYFLETIIQFQNVTNVNFRSITLIYCF